MKRYKLGLYEKAMVDSLSLQEKLLLAKKVGYDFLELSIDESDEKLGRLAYSAQELSDLLAFSREILPFGSICLSGHRRYPLGDRQTAKRSLEIMEKSLNLAAFLGIPIIQLAGYDIYYGDSTGETRALFQENLAKCATLAAQYGVILAFETMETPFMNSVEKALYYVKLINSPYLQIYPDLGNVVNAVQDPHKDLISGKGHIVALHIKESLPGLFREIPYGEGHVDFPGLLKTAWALGVRRYVSEFWHNSALDWQKQIYDSYNFLMEAFFNDTPL
ncbi:MAG: L-ribulose-5-phosphate 3-epimerase [Sphaerochaetaceae bacterium]